MKLHQILSPSFRSILAQLQQESFTLYHPASMVQRSSSICSQFCKALVSCGYLSFEQMLHAACRYRLGASAKGGVIFWQIDHEGSLHDGKVMYYNPDCHRNKKTAVILSEHYPQYIWLAAGGLYELKVDKFRPLRGHRIILFPDTDPDGLAYRYWYQTAQEVMASPFWEDSPPIRVSGLLEQQATPAQKAAKIDLVDYLF